MRNEQKLTEFIFFIILIIFGSDLSAQNSPIIYGNYSHAYNNKSTLNESDFFETRVNEITLNADATFEFWSRPDVSCLTWQQYKGNWKKERDTNLFYDTYQVAERDTRITFNKDITRQYHISFLTDQKSELKNKDVKVQYVYDFDSQLEETENTFYLGANNIIEIPFQDIPNHNKLASMRIKYALGEKDRVCYLTENKTANVRNGDLPNIIGVEFVETPKTETVYRITKGLIRNNTIAIVSVSRNTTSIPDYNTNPKFEDSYTLLK